MNNDVKGNVELFLNAITAEYNVYKALGIPLDLFYTRTIFGEGVDTTKESIPITLQNLYDYYASVSLTEARTHIGLSVSTGMYVKYSHWEGTEQSKLKSEEKVRRQIQPQFVEKLTQQGYDTEFLKSVKPMGYSYIDKNWLLVPFFSGYPRKELYPTDFKLNLLLNRLQLVEQAVVGVPLRLVNTDGEETYIKFNTFSDLSNFISSDGTDTYISNTGTIALRMRADLHGNGYSTFVEEATTGRKIQLKGIYTTDVKII